MSGPGEAGTGGTGSTGGTGGTGGFAEESARLLAALQEWAAKGRAAAQDLAGGAEAATAGMGHSPECSVCPVCQAVRLLRSMRPEVVEHLGDAATSFLSALSTLVTGDGEQEPAGRRTRKDDVQHIDVTGDEETRGPTGAAG